MQRLGGSQKSLFTFDDVTAYFSLTTIKTMFYMNKCQTEIATVIDFLRILSAFTENDMNK